MKTLLSVATVIDGGGNWTKANGSEYDDLTCGRTYGTADVCEPPTVSPTFEPAETGFQIVPFIHHAEQEFGTRFTPADAEASLTQAMRDSAEYVVGRQLWSGDTPSWAGAGEGVYLAHADVQTVAAGANVPASISAAVRAATVAHPEIEPVVHLGLGASYALPPGWADEHPALTLVENAGYPTNGIAVTDSAITVRLGTIETISTIAHASNRRFISGTRLVAIEFGPCSAVRVA